MVSFPACRYRAGVDGLDPSLLNLVFQDLSEPSSSECEAYERYILLPELSSEWGARLWPEWEKEGMVRPALQSLELSFRMISYVLCDVRAYVDKEEWTRRLEDLVNMEVEMVAVMCENDRHAPVAKLEVGRGVLAVGEAVEVWQRRGAQAVVSRCSQESLLPRLACWSRSHDMAARLRLAVESSMLRAPFTLGLGEPNLSSKPSLLYDLICKPLHTYNCRRPLQKNPEDHTLSTAHQIFECWLFIAHQMLSLMHQSIHGDLKYVARLCRMVERIWKILSATMDLLHLMDTDDFMKLKQELAINTSFGGAFCLRSNMLRTVTRLCKELRHLVPKLVGVEADPKGGPRLQEALMEVLHSHGTQSEHHVTREPASLHVLQSFQAIEMAVKKFFFGYQQLVICVMGSGAFKGSHQALDPRAPDAISQIYFEPPYFPSLDGAKTFLGDYWVHQSCDDEDQEMKQSMCSSSRSSGSTDLSNPSMQFHESSPQN